jgi:hypothetical protein
MEAPFSPAEIPGTKRKKPKTKNKQKKYPKKFIFNQEEAKMADAA